MEVEWVAGCRLTPRSSCRCSVPRWEVVVEAEVASTASGVACQAAGEELRRDFQVASSFDMMRRRTEPGSSPRMTSPQKISMQGTSCGQKKAPWMNRSGGFVDWDWGYCWLASLSLLISWQSRPLLGQECTFAFDLCYTCGRGRALHRLAG